MQDCHSLLFRQALGSQISQARDDINLNPKLSVADTRASRISLHATYSRANKVASLGMGLHLHQLLHHYVRLVVNFARCSENTTRAPTSSGATSAIAESARTCYAVHHLVPNLLQLKHLMPNDLIRPHTSASMLILMMTHEPLPRDLMPCGLTPHELMAHERRPHALCKVSECHKPMSRDIMPHGTLSHASAPHEAVPRELAPHATASHDLEGARRIWRRPFSCQSGVHGAQARAAAKLCGQESSVHERLGRRHACCGMSTGRECEPVQTDGMSG